MSIELTADCSRCTALCCVLLPYSRSSGFGADKPGGVPCHHLADDDRCRIHAELTERGWPGCVAFDCFGAGQQMTQVTYAGTSWRDRDADGRAEMAAVLSVLRRVHESLRHVEEARRRSPAATADALRERLVALDARPPEELLAVDLDALLDEVRTVLVDRSRALRGDGRPSLARADLAGQDLRARDLDGADLRGALLIAADLRDVRLGPADLLGADLRDTDLRGTDLSDVLFLTGPQVTLARGDRETVLPPGLPRPSTWP